MQIRRLTPKLRKELKFPLGLLISGSFEETSKAVKRLIEKQKPVKTISVGDVVSETLIRSDVYPDVLVVDNKVLREPVKSIEVEVNRTLCLKNPAGVLTEEAWVVMREALEQEGVTRIMVDGEEDLFTMVAVLCAPKGSLIFYGQPGRGMVAVKVTEKTIGKVRRVVDAMEVSADEGKD